MNWDSSNFNGRMAAILRAFPNVNWVCLQGFPAYPLPNELYKSNHGEVDPILGQVETLVLKDGSYEGGSSFVEEILSAFCNVHKLECEKLTFTVGSSQNPLKLGHTLLPRLRELCLHNPQEPLVELITTRLSMKNIQRLSLKSSGRSVPWGKLLNKIHSGDQDFSLELSKAVGVPRGKLYCFLLLLDTHAEVRNLEFLSHESSEDSHCDFQCQNFIEYDGNF
jgi:hypothetical protein